MIHKEKCKPTICGRECKKYCPIEKKELDSCVVIDAKCKIDESTCIGCGICQRRCPFGAIDIVNLPSVDASNLIYRYGQNGFALYGLPIPKEKSVVGMLGRNGIGKSTAVKILAGKDKINLGVDASDDEVRAFFKGNEMLRYFDNLNDKKIAYKPQNLSALSVDVVVEDLLNERGNNKKIKELAERLGVSHVLPNKLNKLSGGELQKVAIIAASLDDADIYFFDEPLAYLDIAERLRVSDFIKEIASSGKTIVVVEHDLLILDYLTDYLNIFYGGQGTFGTVSGLKVAKNGVNSYLSGFLKEENMRIRDKELNFNFTKNKSTLGASIAEWPDFSKKFESGFEFSVEGGSIKKNNVVGILGKNGTGETSFVKCLAGLEDVLIDGKNKKLDLKLDISYKPQYLFSEDDGLVRDVIIREKIGKKISSLFNIGVLNQKKISELSGGELQRFSIARCLAKDADVYLIDEPSAYLDVEERVSVAKAIKDLMVEKEKTAFIVDHDLLLVSYLADSIIVFSGESGVKGEASGVKNFEEGIGELLKSLDITLRKDVESGRPRINKRGSVLDREQKSSGDWCVF